MRPDAPVPNPYARPSSVFEPEPPRQRDPQKQAGTARRLAGAFMILNAVLVLTETILTPAAAKSPAPGFGPGMTFIPALLDLVIGFTLVRGSSALAWFAIVRAVLGMTAGVAMRASEGPFVMVYQVLVCASFLGLLVGEAQRVRMAVAGSAMALAMIVELVIIGGLAVGQYPLAVMSMRMSGEIEPGAVERVTGIKAPWEVTFPPGKWYSRAPALVAKEGPALDRWLMRPDRDVHVLVLAEEAPNAALPIDAYVDAVIANVRKEVPGIVFSEREPWPLFAENGRTLHASGKREGTEYVWRYAFVTTFGRGFYLVAFGVPGAMESLDEEISAIFSSFRLPAAVVSAVAEDVDPAPITTVRGLKLPYSITAPNRRWNLRKPEAVQRDNPVLDRWITRSDLDAHVLVIAEEVQTGTLDVHAFVEVLLESAKKGTTRFEVVRREPWAKFPNEGVRLRVSLDRDGMSLEYEYGMWAKGPRGFQVIAFAPKASYPTVAGDLIAVIDSFELPP